ncbi:MAG: hypothetical protein F6J95_028790 [Leptolyngbya sp. SIO1E4]|nr:hypothetical protein [Leptolyngbya sp. SIO1E4]
MSQGIKSPSPVRWRKLLVKGTFWLSSEIVLGLMGVDTLADYSEFLIQSRVASHVSEAIAAVTTLM